MCHSNIPSQYGSLTLEILIAFSLLITTLIGTTLIIFGTQTTSLAVSETAIHTVAMHTYLADMRAFLKKNWSASLTDTPSSESMSISQETNLSPCMKKISIETTLGTEKNSASFFIGSPEEALKFGGSCDPFPLTDTWDTPEVQSTTLLSSGTSTGISIQTKGASRYAYVTTQSATAHDPDLYIVDVTNTYNPHIVSSLDTGNGLSGIARGGEYAYTLQNDSKNQLQVIDLHIPENPTVVTNVPLPNLPSCSATSTACYPGRSIFYYDGRVYIGTAYIAFGSTALHNNEFHIFCVSDTTVPGCSPAHPIWLGSLNVNHNINDIFVQGEYAYLATSDSEGELMMINIADPTRMTHPDSIGARFNARTTSGSASTEDGMSVYVLGTRTFLGRARTNSATERDFYILDTSVPSAIAVLSSTRLGLSTKTDVSDMFSQGSRAFLATTDRAKPLLVFDISDTENPVQQNTCATLPRATAHLAYADNVLFASSQGALLEVFADSASTCP